MWKVKVLVSCSGSSCRHAVGPGCVCPCGGSNHGAKARICWATAMAVCPALRTDAEEKLVATAETQRQRATAMVRTQESSLRKAQKKPRRKDASWFFESGRSVEIVDWLVSHPTEREQIDWMADQVGEVCELLLNQNPHTHRRLADHFWCDVLAALARVLDEALSELDSLPGELSEAFISALSERTWEAVRNERGSSKGNAPTRRQSTQNDSYRIDEDIDAGLSEVMLKRAVKELVSILLSGVNEAAHLTLDNIVQQGVVIRSKSYAQRFLDMFKQTWSWSP
jgi:arsenate reductase-like glutaredoxin family protein